MKIAETILPGVYVIEPHVHADARGFLLETWHATRYAQARLPAQFVQSNHSRSIRGTLRGLHYQLTHPQGKLVWVVQGRVFDVAVDLRVGSPTFGRWISESLSEDNHRQLYVPPGVAHGFCTVSNARRMWASWVISSSGRPRPRTSNPVCCRHGSRARANMLRWPTTRIVISPP